MDKTLRIEYIPVTDLEPYDRNARSHGEEDVNAIKKSIEEYGFNDPIGVWSDHNVIVEGHGRLQAAKELGMDRVPVIRLDHLSDEERRAYAIMHNRTAELSEWNMEALKKELEELDLDIFLENFESLGFNPDDFLTEEEDEVPELPEEPTAKEGQLWKLGRHYLMVGDSTLKELVKKLTRGGCGRLAPHRSAV